MADVLDFEVPLSQATDMKAESAAVARAGGEAARAGIRGLNTALRAPAVLGAPIFVGSFVESIRPESPLRDAVDHVREGRVGQREVVDERHPDDGDDGGDETAGERLHEWRLCLTQAPSWRPMKRVC